MDGGKAVEETWTCYEYLFTTLGIGAERLYLVSDGAMISYTLLMLLAWACHVRNPRRMFVSAVLLSLEQGHSYLPVDTQDHRLTVWYNKRNRWAQTAERHAHGANDGFL